MADGNVVSAAPATDGGSDSGSIFWWIGGAAILATVVGGAYYYLVVKKPATSDKPEGIEVDIKNPDGDEDKTVTTDKFLAKGAVKAAAANAPVTVPASTIIPASATNSPAASSNGFHIGQNIISDGDNSIQRMKPNKSSGTTPVDKDDSGKIWGYSKVKDKQLLGTVSVLYNDGILVKSPPKYLFPYYYVTYDQILGQ